MASNENTASCLCGDVKIALSGTPRMTVVCHCLSCQKSSGAACMTNAFYPLDHVKFLSDDSKLNKFHDSTCDSGSTLERASCARCGSNISIKNITMQPLRGIVIPIGIIDGDKSEFKPQQEFFSKRKAPWLQQVDGSMVHEAMPSRKTKEAKSEAQTTDSSKI